MNDLCRQVLIKEDFLNEQFMASTSDQTIRAKLRFLTAQAHADLESLWSVSDGFASKAVYMRFLERAWRVHRGLGQAAATVWGDADALDVERERIACLAEDLGGRSASCPSQPGLSVGYAWGVAYVLNGSSLGASIMLKRGDIPRDWPDRYFQHGRQFVQTGQLKRFMDRLNSADIDLTDATRGARACFEAFSAVPDDGLEATAEIKKESHCEW